MEPLSKTEFDFLVSYEKRIEEYKSTIAQRVYHIADLLLDLVGLKPREPRPYKMWGDEYGNDIGTFDKENINWMELEFYKACEEKKALWVYHRDEFSSDFICFFFLQFFLTFQEEIFPLLKKKIFSKKIKRNFFINIR